MKRFRIMASILLISSSIISCGTSAPDNRIATTEIQEKDLGSQSILQPTYKTYGYDNVTTPAFSARLKSLEGNVNTLLSSVNGYVKLGDFEIDDSYTFAAGMIGFTNTVVYKTTLQSKTNPNLYLTITGSTQSVFPSTEQLPKDVTNVELTRYDKSDIYSYERFMLANAKNKSVSTVIFGLQGEKLIGADLDIPFSVRDPQIFFPIGFDGYLPSLPIIGEAGRYSSQSIDAQKIIVSPKCYQGDEEVPHPNGGVSGQSIIVCSVINDDSDFGCPDAGSVTSDSMSGPVVQPNSIGVLCITSNPDKLPPACPTIPVDYVNQLNTARVDFGLASADFAEAEARFIQQKYIILNPSSTKAQRLKAVARLAVETANMTSAGNRMRDAKNREQSALRNINEFKKSRPDCF